MTTLINFSNMTSPQALLTAPNVVTHGYFWTGMLWMFIIVMFMAMLNFDLEIAFMAAMFVGMLAGILLLYAGLISPLWLGVIIGGLILSFIVNYMKSPRNN